MLLVEAKGKGKTTLKRKVARKGKVFRRDVYIEDSLRLIGSSFIGVKMRSGEVSELNRMNQPKGMVVKKKLPIELFRKVVDKIFLIHILVS